MSIFSQALKSTVETAGVVVKIDRFRTRNYHKPGQPLEWYRMVLIETESGELVQWFGSSMTDIWRDGFSTKYAADPIGVGCRVSVVGTVHEQRKADKHFGNRTIVHNPRFVKLTKVS